MDPGACAESDGAPVGTALGQPIHCVRTSLVNLAKVSPGASGEVESFFFLFFSQFPVGRVKVARGNGVIVPPPQVLLIPGATVGTMLCTS